MCSVAPPLTEEQIGSFNLAIEALLPGPLGEFHRPGVLVLPLGEARMRGNGSLTR